MSATRWITATALAALGCLALAGSSNAKIRGISGSMIAYERGGDIWVMSDQGAGVFDVNITNSPGVADGAPSWGQPDRNCLLVGGDVDLTGRRTLVYESRPGAAASDIVLARLTGYPPAISSTENLTAASGDDNGAPAAFGAPQNPDGPLIGPLIVFTRGPVGSRDLWAVDSDSGRETRLTSAPADDHSPDWSSDGEAVVYESADAAGSRQLAIIDVLYDAQLRVAGAGPPRFVTGGADRHGEPSWYGTPGSDDADPSRVAHLTSASATTYLDYVEQAPPTSGELFAPTSVPAPLLRQLTGDPGGDSAPSWRSEGDMLAFESDREQPGNFDVYRINADGTGLLRLTQDPAAEHAPDWEPIGAGCLLPAPYSPRPGTQTRDGRPAPRPNPQQPLRPQAPLSRRPRSAPARRCGSPGCG